RNRADTEDPIERMGIDRTRRALAEADLVIMVFDASQPMSPADLQVIEAAKEATQATRLAVANKLDLPLQINLDELREKLGEIEVASASATEPGGTYALEEKVTGLVLSGKAAHRQDGPT